MSSSTESTGSEPLSLEAGRSFGLGGAWRLANGKYTLHGEALASTSFDGGHGLKGTLGFTMGF